MAVWDVTSAISTLRSLLGDNQTDKYEFKVDVFPTPDSVTKKFFVGQTRVVQDSLQVFVDGVQAVSGAPSGIVEIDYEKGSFDLLTAPSGHLSVQASFYYQWFKDAELNEFLFSAVSMLGFETPADDALPVGVRSACLDFACYYAYMKKAAEYADSITATAQGYTADQSKSHPNWRDLAKTAFEKGKAKLDIYAENPLAGSITPQMRFVSFRLPRWQGP